MCRFLAVRYSDVNLVCIFHLMEPTILRKNRLLWWKVPSAASRTFLHRLGLRSSSIGQFRTHPSDSCPARFKRLILPLRGYVTTFYQLLNLHSVDTRALCQKNEVSVEAKQRPVKMDDRTIYRTPFQTGIDRRSHL
jgi:hypothetical protein